jgi:hypothetical protein
VADGARTSRADCTIGNFICRNPIHRLRDSATAAGPPRARLSHPFSCDLRPVSLDVDTLPGYAHTVQIGPASAEHLRSERSYRPGDEGPSVSPVLGASATPPSRGTDRLIGQCNARPYWQLEKHVTVAWSCRPRKTKEVPDGHQLERHQGHGCL